jgi:hypothetical protein
MSRLDFRVAVTASRRQLHLATGRLDDQSIIDDAVALTYRWYWSTGIPAHTFLVSGDNASRIDSAIKYLVNLGIVTSSTSPVR